MGYSSTRDSNRIAIGLQSGILTTTDSNLRLAIDSQWDIRVIVMYINRIAIGYLKYHG